MATTSLFPWVSFRSQSITSPKWQIQRSSSFVEQQIVGFAYRLFPPLEFEHVYLSVIVSWRVILFTVAPNGSGYVIRSNLRNIPQCAMEFPTVLSSASLVIFSSSNRASPINNVPHISKEIRRRFKTFPACFTLNILPLDNVLSHWMILFWKFWAGELKKSKTATTGQKSHNGPPSTPSRSTPKAYLWNSWPVSKIPATHEENWPIQKKGNWKVSTGDSLIFLLNEIFWTFH